MFSTLPQLPMPLNRSLSASPHDTVTSYCSVLVLRAAVQVVLVVDVAPRRAEADEPQRTRRPVEVQLDHVGVEVVDVVGRVVVDDGRRRGRVDQVGPSLQEFVLQPAAQVFPAGVAVLEPVAVVVGLRRLHVLGVALDALPVEAAEQLVGPVERPRRVEPGRVLRVAEQLAGLLGQRRERVAGRAVHGRASRSSVPWLPRRYDTGVDWLSLS